MLIFVVFANMGELLLNLKRLLVEGKSITGWHSWGEASPVFSLLRFLFGFGGFLRSCQYAMICTYALQILFL